MKLELESEPASPPKGNFPLLFSRASHGLLAT